MASLSPSDAARRSRQLRRIESKFLASLAHHAWVKSLARASERNAGLSGLSMHRYHDVTFVPPGMLVTIDPAPLLDQPFSKCCTFHCSAPVDNRTDE
jgi:hypothetical protein